MKDFRTNVSITPNPVKLTLHDKILTTGSCFADAIGSRLSRYKFATSVNAFGTTYNPHSIHQALRQAVFNEPVPEHTYVENQGICLNYNFHSSFSDPAKENLRQKLQETIGGLHYFLRDARWLMLTYGTAWVYERRDTGEIVANCHKMPADRFTKRLLTQRKMIESFDQLYHDLQAFNPDVQIILTVSPVRHLKDTLPLNSVSKSVLRLGCHTLSERYENVHYFPGYEIVVDDLRDYRFYKEDMIHPSQEAEEFIWKKFLEGYADEETQIFVDKWETILKALSHKPFHPASQQHQQFLEKTLRQIEELKSQVDVGQEISLIKSQLQKHH